ncbi:MAG TPA: ferritin [Thermoleophilaceae bacterium]|nr:ferritin [Thermoleophilaceae bacterium]
MPAQRFVDALNAQIANELAASHQYLAAAIWYDAQTFPRLAAFFYRQALEERDHAMMMVRYLLDTDSQAVVPDVRAPQAEFEDFKAPIALGLEQERQVGDEIDRLAGIAREEQDYRSENFVSWFLKEQVEEVATMAGLLQVAERAAERPQDVEDHLAREGAPHEARDPTAPPIAGG